MSEYDTVFTLPSVDEEPGTELGVLLMGLGPERLLAGLGVAADRNDPVAVALVADQVRHGARRDLTVAAALDAGGRRWRSALPRLTAAAPAGAYRSAALRRQWAAAEAVVAAAGVAAGAAERVYLAACWLRREEIERLAINDDP
ncbi:DUF6187 family protein [Actinophytocola sp. NPDC049390]|uniref:DUF6187 family protein n=1 Tax=Actinophytocola sp. NPDC049390 TaxID=3363894 RepID=UPI0037B18ED0